MNDTGKTTTLKQVQATVSPIAENWRERFLKAILIGASIFGLIALILNIIQAPSQEFLFSYLIAYAFLIILTVAPIRYNFRAAATLFLIFALGVVGLVQDGLWGDARLFFLAFVGISLLLFSPRAGIIALVVSLFTLGVGWWLLNNQVISISNPEINVIGSSITWITNGAMLLLISVIFISGLFILQQDFVTTREQYKLTLDDLQKERAELEQRVEERTFGLARKTEQLRAASYITRRSAALQDLGSLLSSVVNLIAKEYDYYHVGIFLTNEKGDQAILQATSSDGGQRMLAKGYSVNLASHDPIAISASQTRAIVRLDVGENAAIFNNPDLPSTRSQIVLPIVLRGKSIGVLDIQSSESRAFSQSDFDVLQSLADHLAISIENARLLNETQTVLMQLEAVNVARTKDAWTERLKEKSQAYTYTSLGLRPDKAQEDDPNSYRVPIALRGHQIGTITLSKGDSETWDENDHILASKVAGQVGLAVDNLRLLEEAQKSAQRDQTLTYVSNRMRETLDMDSILQNAVRELQRVLNLKEAEIRVGSPQEKNIKDGFVKPQTGALTLKPKKTTGRLRSG